MRLFAFVLLASTCAFSQAQRAAIPKTPSWQVLARMSGMIFSGEVVQVNRSASSGTTHITFRVETAIRGVRRGEIVQIHEWSPLWNAGERYATGEHVLLFLYPRSKLGLTSPVRGKDGRFAVNSRGQVLFDDSLREVHGLPLKNLKAEIARSAGQ